MTTLGKEAKARKGLARATYGCSWKMENEIMEVAVVDVVETVTATATEVATEGIGEDTEVIEVATAETETKEVAAVTAAAIVAAEKREEKSPATPVNINLIIEERILSAVEAEEPCQLYYLNIFNLSYELTDEEIIEFYAKNKVEVNKVHKSVKDAADLEFKSKEELIKAIDIGDYTLKGRTVYVRSSFLNSKGQRDFPPRGRGYGGFSRGRGSDRGGRGERSERFNSDSYNDQERGFSPRDKPQEEAFQRAGGDNYERGGFGSGHRARSGGQNYGGGFGGDRFRNDGPRDFNNQDSGRGSGAFRTRGGSRDVTEGRGDANSAQDGMREAESNHNKFDDQKQDYGKFRGDRDRPPRGTGYRGRGGDDREYRGRGGRGRGGFGVR
jgi:RNA recognition motif-containing protein